MQTKANIKYLGTRKLTRNLGSMGNSHGPWTIGKAKTTEMDDFVIA